MSLTEDSPPFVSLRSNAASLKALVDSDVTSCLDTLDSKITALMCDPDSLGGSGSSSSRKSSVHVEFSMAKYAILARMREMYEEAEKGWLDKLDSMREDFFEKVELFLASTRLEVKLPDVKPTLAGQKNSPAVRSQEKSSKVSSIYPKLFSSAKSIPVFGSLLRDNQENESDVEDEEEPTPSPPKQTGRTPKRVTIAEEFILTTDRNGSHRGRRNQGTSKTKIQTNQEVEYLEEDMTEEEPVIIHQTPPKRGGRGKKSAVNTPASVKKETAGTPLGRRNNKREPVETREEVTERVSTPGRRGRTPRKKANDKEVPYQEEEIVVMDISDDESVEAVTSVQKTSRQVEFSLGLDPNEDLEIYSPEMSISRSAPRRKTFVTRSTENFQEVSVTPEVTRSRSKRKTFAGSQLNESAVAPSPKRLRKSVGRSGVIPSATEKSVGGGKTNLLESEGVAANSPWIELSEVSSSVQARPGVYELKVSQAKRPAYIGDAESLRQVLTLHKLSQSSGHKHLDKFIERNLQTLLVRYAYCDTAKDAKQEAGDRLNEFKDNYKTTPAYN